MTVAQVARNLNCHYRTVYRLLKKGELPGFRLGGSWRMSREIRDQLLREESTQPKFLSGVLREAPPMFRSDQQTARRSLE
jgi:excisionase family DNA binding protein